MEIAIVIAFILVMFALALSRTRIGLFFGGMVKLAGTALGLSLVMAAALCRPRRASAV